MKKLLAILLIVGFLFVDFIFFHDVFKPGESTSLGQYLTGFLSIPVILVSVISLFEKDKTRY